MPAKVKADLAQRLDFVARSEEILGLNEKLKGLTVNDEIKALCSYRDEAY